MSEQNGEENENRQDRPGCECNGCCGSSSGEGEGKDASRGTPANLKEPWMTGRLQTASLAVPVVATRLSWRDRLGSLRARLGVGRFRYAIPPGLYAVGQPNAGSRVFVSANYKLSFDALRQELGAIDGWILVLDTQGINVWCAAGKGTFGTGELARRIEETGLAGVVSHRTLILPQLAAPGVAAHEVTKLSRFKVVYGPVRAADIRAFLEAGLQAAPGMRRVRFNLFDRLVLTPLELVLPLKYGIAIAALLLLADVIFGIKILSWPAAYPYIGAIVVGTVIVPALLPWIPGRAFALKGGLLGFAWAALVNVHQGLIFSPAPHWSQAAVHFLLLPAISAFLAMYFTGSSTYTSLSGVVREMKYAVPAIAVSTALGIVLLVTVLVGAF